MTHAPIALFVYNRPDHVRRTLASLLTNPEAADSELHVFSDGPRTASAAAAVAQTRAIVRDTQGFRSVTLIERATNFGLANSIIAGVELVLAKYGCVIVVEDDLILSPAFLAYMNTALKRYADAPSVYQISGHMFDIDLSSIPDDALFLPLTTSWGWATWERAWRAFDPAMSGLDKIEANQALRRRFDLDGAYPYFDMLLRQKAGLVDSWAIRWYLSVFLRDGLVLFPRASLVQNGGMDGSGTHCGNGSEAQRDLPRTKFTKWPDRIDVSPAFDAIKAALARDARMQLTPRAIAARLRRLLFGAAAGRTRGTGR